MGNLWGWGWECLLLDAGWTWGNRAWGLVSCTPEQVLLGVRRRGTIRREWQHLLPAGSWSEGLPLGLNRRDISCLLESRGISHLLPTVYHHCKESWSYPSLITRPTLFDCINNNTQKLGSHNNIQKLGSHSSSSMYYVNTHWRIGRPGNKARVTQFGKAVPICQRLSFCHLGWHQSRSAYQSSLIVVWKKVSVIHGGAVWVWPFPHSYVVPHEGGQ